MNWEKFLDELPGRLFGIALGVGVGWFLGWLFATYKRRKERINVLAGDARETVVIQVHQVEAGTRPDGTAYPKSLRVRSLGQSPLLVVVPNGHLSRVLRRRAGAVAAGRSLIDMDGAEGSYLLETLTNYVCDRVANAPFDHDLYVMAPCCEPADLTDHQPITVLLIRVADLPLFGSWDKCRDVAVEHGGDGVRVLTLLQLAKRYASEQAEIARRRAAGQRTRHLETMYILDLCLDQRSAPIPLKPVPWTRFTAALTDLGLE